MADTKYCHDCHARVLSSESVCPYCGGELGDFRGADEADIPIIPTVPAGLGFREFMRRCITIREKSSIRMNIYVLMFAVLVSVFTAGECITNPVSLSAYIVTFGLTVAVYLTNSAVVAISVSAVSLGVTLFNYITAGAASGFLPLIAGAYLSFQLVKNTRQWLAYKKSGVAYEAVNDSATAAKYRENSMKKVIIVISVFAVVFAALTIGFFIFQHGEDEKYGGFTTGVWNGDNYTNEFAGVELALPEAWKPVDGDTLAEKNKTTFSGYREKQACFCYWLEKDGNKDNYAYLELYKQSTENYTAEDFVKLNRDNRKEQYKESKADYEFSEIYSIKYSGNEYSGITSHVKLDDKDEYQYLLARTYYKYTIILLFSADSEENAEAMLEAFGLEINSSEESTDSDISDISDSTDNSGTETTQS